MLSPELVAQIKSVELRARYLASEVLAGEYVSAFKGHGMEFDEVREYSPGDDIRSIDWNVTARMSRPFVKVFREEREMTVMLLVDVSNSLAFGTTKKAKIEVAAEFAAVIAFLATRNNDRVGLLAYDNQLETYIPPKKGRGHVWRIIRAVLAQGVGKGRLTDLSGALEYMRRVLKRRATIFVISDLLAADFRKQLMSLASSHDVVLVRVIDPRESQDVGSGLMCVQDLETGEMAVVQMPLPSDRNRGRGRGDENRVFGEWLQTQRQGLRAGLFELPTDGNIVAPLEKFLRQRGRK